MTDSRTKQAARKVRTANTQRGIARLADSGAAFIHHREVERLDQEAAELLTVTEPFELSMGEVVPEGGEVKQALIRDTLDSPTQCALDASVARTDLLLQESGDVTALAIDAADSIGAGNSLEKMLAHQMALVHQAGFEIMAKANVLMQQVGNSGYDIERQRFASVEAARLFNTGARMFQTYQQAMLTFQKIRTGGAQTVTVQHVHISDGGQALIGNLGAAPETGGKNER
jgi:hypothetical protein